MDLINNSRDVLNIVLSFCVLWLTIFIAWFIYYLAMTMRQFFQIVKETRQKINRVDKLIDAFKEKMEHSASHLVWIGEGVKTLMEIIKTKVQCSVEKKKASKKK